MIIVYKYNLILIAILSHDAKHDDLLRSEAEKALDMFYSSYLEDLNGAKESVDVSRFDGFKKLLLLQIRDYFELIDEKEKNKQIGDFGFFTEAIEKSRNGS
ncbi:MAG: hypothetical protein ACFFAO_06695 [Candidatus Hermodarchaeota archaeon]